MRDKNYADYDSMKECAAEIARQCISEGKSEGWSGSEEALDEISTILAPYNIKYVDDMFGTWELRAPKAN